MMTYDELSVVPVSRRAEKEIKDVSEAVAEIMWGLAGRDGWTRLERSFVRRLKIETSHEQDSKLGL